MGPTTVSSTRTWPSSAMTDPFEVHVAVLRRVVGTVVHERCEGPFDPEGILGPLSPAASRVPEGADLVVEVDLQSYAGGITARGVAEAPWEGLCSRCAVEVRGSLRCALEERFSERGGSEADPEAYPISEEKIEVGTMAREAVLVELPLLPMCRPDCAGLCPSCGIDRNEERCSCTAPRDDRWAALDALVEPPESSAN